MIQCACGSHDTDVVTYWYEYEYKGHVQTVECSYSECWDCGLEFQTATQFNNLYREKRMAEFTIDQWIIDNSEE